MYRRQESNLHLKLRRLSFYPLNYGGSTCVFKTRQYIKSAGIGNGISLVYRVPDTPRGKIIANLYGMLRFAAFRVWRLILRSWENLRGELQNCNIDVYPVMIFALLIPSYNYL